ncbi:hypothetical protein TWF703_007528 [Orbilia oligospora]|uniref:Nephrocystin 3-like N-terminal domain-containing protein n=1 Tax=Orbilia oligospora TaxID=2813651 RepID=A0A7C8P6A9_ORBOL|nr:hypothetical protein TWF703_007528 [Orbilia oligospora]
MFESQPIRAATAECRKSLSTCLAVSRLKEGGWAENRLIDFNLWAAGAGVSAKGKLSLDQRLSTKPDVQSTLVNLLKLLQMPARLLAKDVDSALDKVTDQEAEPESNVNSMVERVDENLPVELSSKEAEARRDVEVTLDQIIRLTVAIRKAGSSSRLKRADKSFDLDSPKIQELRGFLELIMHPKGLKEEGQLTPIQSRLVEANLRRWHRFSYAKLHSKKLARSDTAPMEAIPENPNPTLEHKPQAGSKPAVSFDIPETNKALQVSIVVPEGQTPRALSVMAPTATTAASAIEDIIIIPDKPIARTPVTDCQQPLQLYLTRKDWEQHIKTEHGQIWICAVCEQLGVTTEFSNEEELVEHLGTSHKDSVDSDEVQMFVTASSSSKPVEAVDCPLCTGPDEGEDSLEHIAHCVHDFSLNSLPLPSDSDAEGDYFDIDSRNSESQNTPSSASAEERDFEGLAEIADDASSVDDEHKVSESSLKTLTRDFSGPTGISILDWKVDEATEDPQAATSVDVTGEDSEETTADQFPIPKPDRPDEASLYGPTERARYQVAWLCPTKMDAVIAEALLDQVDLIPVTSQASGSMFEYRLGRIEPHRLVIAWPSESDRYRGSDWCLAEEIKKVFRSLAIFLHVGTGAGVPSLTYLSDVVVSGADGLTHYKISKSGTFNGRTIRPRAAPDLILSTIQDIGHEFTPIPDPGHISENRDIIINYRYTSYTDLTDVNFASEVNHMDYVPRGVSEEEQTCERCYHVSREKKLRRRPGYSAPKVYHDGIAYVENLFTKGTFPLFAPGTNVRCVDMEGDVSTYTKIDNIVVIRGISSYTDTHKDIRWKRIAAGTAAAYAKQFIRVLDPRGLDVPPDKGGPIDGSEDGSEGMGLNDFDAWSHSELEASAAEDNPVPGGAKSERNTTNFAPSITHSDTASMVDLFLNENDTVRDDPKAKCLFRELPCPYETTKRQDWIEHIKEHLVLPGIMSSDLGLPVWAHPQPLSWACGFEECEESQNLPDENEMEWLDIERGGNPLSDNQLRPLDAYRLQNSLETEATLDSKLGHIFSHLVTDKWNLEEYHEREDWTEFFQSIPVKLLVPEVKSASLEQETLLDATPKKVEGDGHAEEGERGKETNSFNVDFGKVHRKYIQDRVDGTSIWFAGLPEFREWRDTPGLTLLYEDSPGSGKSTIMATIYETLRKQYGENADVVIVYCGEALPGGARWTTRNFMQCIRRQLHPDSTLIQYLLEAEEGPQDALLEEPGALSNFLSSTFEFSRRNFILVDGLENLGPLEALELKFSIWVHSGVNLLCTARPGMTQTAGLTGPCITSRESTDPLKRDIRSFLRHKFAEYPGILSQDDKVLRAYIAEVEDIACGVFKIASLFIEHLTGWNLETTKDLQLAKQWTRDTNFCLDFYDDFRRRIILDPRHDAQKYALKAITLIGQSISGREPFTPSGLSHALHAHVYGTSNEISSELVSTGNLVAYCQGLVIYDSRRNTFQLFHATAYQYFKVIEWEWYPGGQYSALDATITYLSSSVFKTGPCPNKLDYEKRLSTHAYFSYASKEWTSFPLGGFGGVDAPEFPVEVLRKTLGFLGNDSLVAAVNQVRKVERENPPNYEVSEPIKGIHLAAAFGWGWFIDCLAEFQDINARDYNGYTPLAHAIDASRSGVVGLLKDKGASFSDIKHHGSTALIEAIMSGSSEMIKSILDLGEDPEAPGIPSGSETSFLPINLAILKQQKSVTEILLPYNLDMGLQDGKMRTPLICAVMVGDIDSATHIIKYGRNVDLEARGGPKRFTALGYAVATEQLGMIRLLVTSGASLKAKFKNEGTIMDLAWKYCNFNIISYLGEQDSVKNLKFEAETINSVPPLSMYSLVEDFPRAAQEADDYELGRDLNIEDTDDIDPGDLEGKSPVVVTERGLQSGESRIERISWVAERAFESGQSA